MQSEKVKFINLINYGLAKSIFEVYLTFYSKR